MTKPSGAAEKSRTLEEPSPVRLAADVDALWASDSLRARIEGQPVPTGRPALTREHLATAWGQLPEYHRLIIRSRLLLPESQRLSWGQLGRLVGHALPAFEILYEQAFAELRELLWPTHGFPGLHPEIVKRIKSAALYSRIPEPGPDDLIQIVEDLAFEPGFGHQRFRDLRTWLSQHGHAELARRIEEELSPRARRELRLDRADSTSS